MYRINLENVNEYRKLDNQLKEIEKTMKAMKADFILQLTEEGIEEKTVGNGKGKVSYKNRPENRVNQTKLFEAYPELKEEFTETKDKYYFSVK